MPFFDTDGEIEKREGCSVPDILNTRGEKYFRKVESNAIRNVLETRAGPKVIALGGGVFTVKGNRDLVFDSGLVVYLSCSVLEILRRLSGCQNEAERPLLKVKPRPGETMRAARLRRIKSLLDKRVDRYSEADIRISTTSKTPRMVAAELKKKLERFCDKD